jgi:hypothetical protein
MKKINAQFIGVLTATPIKSSTRCPLEVAKFTRTHSDDHLTETVKEYQHTEFPGMDLWNECLKGNWAWRVMKNLTASTCHGLVPQLRPYT